MQFIFAQILVHIISKHIFHFRHTSFGWIFTSWYIRGQLAQICVFFFLTFLLSDKIVTDYNCKLSFKTFQFEKSWYPDLKQNLKYLSLKTVHTFSSDVFCLNSITLGIVLISPITFQTVTWDILYTCTLNVNLASYVSHMSKE